MTDDEKQPIECHLCDPPDTSCTRVRDLIDHVRKKHTPDELPEQLLQRWKENGIIGEDQTDFDKHSAQYLVREEWGIVRGKEITLKFDDWEDYIEKAKETAKDKLGVKRL